jgi:hypothetical protein
MRSSYYSCVVLGCLVLVSAATGDDQTGKLNIPGAFSIDVPAEGFKWSEARVVQIGDTKGRIYTCSKEQSRSKLVLIVEERSADTEAKKQATLKGHWNSLVITTKEGGFTDIKGTRPSIDAPIPQKVVYGVAGKDKDGRPGVILAVTFFGKHIYALQVFAETEKEAKDLLKAADTFKEQEK